MSLKKDRKIEFNCSFDVNEDFIKEIQEQLKLNKKPEFEYNLYIDNEVTKDKIFMFDKRDIYFNKNKGTLEINIRGLKTVGFVDKEDGKNT